VKVLHVIPAVAPRYGGASHAVFAITDADGNEKLPVALGEKTIYQDIATIFFTRQWSEAFKYSRPLAVWLERNVKNFELVRILFTRLCGAAAACRKRRVPYLVRRGARSVEPQTKERAQAHHLHLGVKQMLTGAAHIHYTPQTRNSWRTPDRV
jgi:hypothetical protein